LLGTLGSRASAAWLEQRGLDARQTPHWYVEITLAARHASDEVAFALNIYPEEWGYVLRAGSRVSSIRVTDVVFVHGKDDHQLLPLTPELDHVGELIALIETRTLVAFRRSRAAVRSNLVRASSVVRAWLHSI
jgi:hypothetical protein